MKKTTLLAALILMAACRPVVVPSGPEDSGHPRDTVPQQKSDAWLDVKADKTTVMTPGETVSITIRSNYDWEYTQTGDILFEKERNDSTLVLAVGSNLNFEDDDMHYFVFESKANSAVVKALKIKVKCPALVDFVFDDDGTAHDASPSKNWIDSKKAVNMMTYYNESAGRNVARFFNGLGAFVDEGFYKFDYARNQEAKDALADGHTMEVLFMLGEELGSVGEVKMFSSMEQGGTGFLITDASRGRQITFLPNTTDASGKAWRWCTSGVVPEVGKYYHVVGVWDKEAGKAKIYVDGQLKNTVAAAGSFNFPNGAASQWLCVGGDPSGASCQSAWNGDVVIARVFDAVLDDAAVAALCARAPKDLAQSSIKISNVLYIPDCQVAPGGTYTVAGDGFKSGDKIVLESSQKFVCSTQILEDRAVVTIPKDLNDGTYKIYVLRGSESAVLGAAILDVTDTPREIHAPKVVAHRGFHKNGRPENSIAAVAAAQNAGFYGAEVDLWITTDGEIFVNHDGTIGGKSIQNSTAADLKGITLSNGEPLPTFKQVLAQAKTNTATRIVIEIKQHSSAERNQACTAEMLRLVDEYGLAADVDYISFGHDICKQIAVAKPGSIIGYLTSTTDLAGLKSDGITCADFAYSYLFTHTELFDKAHDLGMLVNVWTVNSATEMMRAIGLGADFITTDNPDVLADIVERFF